MVAVPPGGAPIPAAALYRREAGKQNRRDRFPFGPIVKPIPLPTVALILTVACAATGCGGGGATSASASQTPNNVPPVPLVQVSAGTPFAVGCGGSTQNATLYSGSTVEPSLAVNPLNPGNLVGFWQQDRWSDGGAQGLMIGASFDGGNTWSRQALPFSQCAGGNALRASDPWVSFGKDGSAYAIGLAFNGGVLQAGSSGGVLVSRSTDGGMTWTKPITLIQDGDQFFNDKETITADPTDASYVYAVWDRLTVQNTGPTYFSRSSDGGATWEAARPIYDPGPSSQTVGNQIVVLPDGTLVLFFTQIDQAADGTLSATFDVLHSADHGSTWSSVPVQLAQSLGVGTRDPYDGTPVRDGVGLLSVAVGPTGRLYAAWQDSRFSGGNHDAIAFAQSGDGGTTWSAPVAINGAPAVPAFTPSLAVAADGTLAVTYYDFRDAGSSSTMLLTDVWFATSSDGGQSWSETRISGPFDLRLAPRSRGYFLGDYQSLAVLPGAFVPFFAQTGGPDISDIYSVDLPLNFNTGAAVRALATALPLGAATAAVNAGVSRALRRQWRQSPPPRQRPVQPR